MTIYRPLGSILKTGQTTILILTPFRSMNSAAKYWAHVCGRAHLADIVGALTLG